MNEIKTIDARGLSCPQPAMLTRQQLFAAGRGTIRVLVDSATARDNISRLAQKEGWQAAVRQEEGNCLVELTK